MDALQEGQKVEFDLEADRKSGKQAATNLKDLGSGRAPATEPCRRTAIVETALPL